VTPQALALTHAAAFSNTRPWSADEFGTLLQAPGVILCGDVKSFILGRLTLDEAEILTVATDPDFRGKGLAKAALLAFEAEVIRRNGRTIFLEVAADNLPALALYAGFGYSETGRRPGYYVTRLGEAVTALVLRKAIGAA
jgi:ribosomal-protein-alanine N-acetyltransferase